MKLGLSGFVGKYLCNFSIKKSRLSAGFCFLEIFFFVDSERKGKKAVAEMYVLDLDFIVGTKIDRRKVPDAFYSAFDGFIKNFFRAECSFSVLLVLCAFIHKPHHSGPEAVCPCPG